jgi:hypothetical protein
MIPSEPIDVEVTVKVLLQAQGITVEPEEFERYVRMYPAMRAGADKLYIPETRYEEPVLIFTPD